ncbi:hypothetical protein [Denitrobaculum tricleocarpae]|uniref:DUF1311 domain-containing protein n=1 Tax=Denitrobaculum tricleocarpae TaxID=2591009 RepID=A0A545TU13_9PROT|nr:hypothetical protein [Denitrobaculum tricleocarpae]TQV80703.1 hypothetical protein FKG95_11135 [Denitrobaculum tricleocarpae]
MRSLLCCLAVAALPSQVYAACDWLAKPDPDAHSIISSRLACLSDPYSLACVEFDEVPRTEREADRLRRIAALELDDTDAANLEERGVWLGATREMVCLAWGKPHRVEEVARNPFGQLWFYGEVDRLEFDGDAIVEIKTVTTNLKAGN